MFWVNTGKGEFRREAELIGVQEEELYWALYWVVDYRLRAGFISGSALK